MSSSDFYDAAIIGGGPAGLSAAIWLGRYLHRVVLFDSGDPRNWETRGIHGYLGLPDVLPFDLRARGRDEARRFGAELVDAHVERITRLGDEEFELDIHPLIVEKATPRELETRSVAAVYRIKARRLLLAFGIKDVWPDVPGLEPCYGDTVHHCPDCDGYESRDCRIAVIASGRSAVGMAFSLATWSDRIIICTNGAAPRIDPEHNDKLAALGIPVRTERITRLINDSGAVRELEFVRGDAIQCDRIFFSIGHGPADDLAEQIGCERDREGMIVVDDAGRTSIPNVFAAGDIVPGPNLGIAAAAQGAIAAAAINKSLMPEGRRL
ncbi:MAG TPA: NAD(P)/FAD-dependent oxidoreductase [Gemmatimonadaceae bacterium]|nr:NAD(P)/FAD-dependent oxidoreductase [Gemmatimonadaceae bacterium]